MEAQKFLPTTLHTNSCGPLNSEPQLYHLFIYNAPICEESE